MITRRDLVVGGALTILWSAAGCPCLADAARSRGSFGCMLDGDEAERFLAISSEHQMYAHGEETIVASSGNREFDYALAHTLSSITDTFHVLPGFAYYDDGDRPNAYATDRVRLAKADGTVLFGRRYLSAILARPEQPDVAAATVCAHEFGHILQYKLNLKPVLLAGQSTVKRLELHADYLAGYYAGIRKLSKPDYPAAVFASTQYSFGDFNPNSPQHHGRPDERAAAIIRGFEVAYRERHNLSDAVRIGVNYVATV